MGIVHHQNNRKCSENYSTLLPSPVEFASLLFLFVLFNAAASQSVVKTLPGYLGNTLPFNLETGYVTVGENEDVELFYYFIQSERDPDRDPLMLWFTGGPGCSAFSGLVYQIGPLSFDFEAYDGGSLPTFRSNPYSWTKIANIIFLDAPVGTGFSYATTSQSYHSSDTNTTEDIYTFLGKWLLEHPRFIKNRLYIGGDSYAGKLVPMITLKISQGIEAGFNPKMHLQGYVLGNPSTDKRIDGNSKVPFAHRLALLSDEYYEMARVNCDGEYWNPDPTNARCLYALEFFKECTRNIYQGNVLEPNCKRRSPKPPELGSDGVGFFDDDDDDENSFIVSSLPRSFPSGCRDNNYVLSNAWANDRAVQEALHVRNGTIRGWKRCNKSISYDRNVESVVHYHELLSHKGFEALVYSGDHDMMTPYIGTLNWIQLLNLTVHDNWRPWLVDGQVAGYTERYIHQKTQSYLTFATVKGAGHTAPEFKPKECLAMMERFFATYPL